METFKHFFRIVDHQTVIVALLAVVATWVCGRFGFAADMPTGLIGVAIVFPIVFSINAAYRRREEALKYFASLKAHAVSLYYAHRDWPPDAEAAGRGETVDRVKGLISALLTAIQDYFTARPEARVERCRAVYEIFSRFSTAHEALRRTGVPANEISRANQYLRAMMIEFERLKNILLYRTPLSLRAYSRIFLNSFPILFGPYFAYLAQKSFPVVGYGVAVLYSVVLVSLDNIQEDLENPFDMVGADDVRLDAAKDYLKLM